MFPTVKVSITGLDPTSKYIVYMDVVPVDHHRYKHHNSQWMVTGAAEPHSECLREYRTSSTDLSSAWSILPASGQQFDGSTADETAAVVQQTETDEQHHRSKRTCKVAIDERAQHGPPSLV